MVSKLKRYKKIAIVHDVLTEYGGAEVVLLELIKLFPNADLYTFIYNKGNKNITSIFPLPKKTSQFFNHAIFFRLGRYLSILKFFSWIHFYFLKLNDYDLVISSSHSYNSKIIRKRKDALHISYIHTPPRYLYSFSHELDFLQRNPFKFFMFPLLHFMRTIDGYAAKSPDILIANSKEVQKRIMKIYHRDSTIIYPPVDLPVKVVKQSDSFFIAHSRLVKQKGLDLIIKTCTKYKLKLVVIGGGHYGNYLESISGKTIFFTGFIGKEQIQQLYKHAKALLYAAKEEDFGIVPVEAQSYGVPVVAYASGGVRETVIHEQTGIFFSNYNESSLLEAINIFEKTKFNSFVCRKNASNYSKAVFKRQLFKLLYEK